MKIVAFDLETTGLDRNTDRIVEFSFVTLDENLTEVAQLESIVNAGMPSSPGAFNVHKITDQEAAKYPAFSHFAPSVQALVQDAVLLAHNHEFDMAILHNELARCGQPGIPIDQAYLDTREIEYGINPNTLEALHLRYVGHLHENAHRARGDTDATVRVLAHQLKKLMGGVAPLVSKGKFLDRDRKFVKNDDGVPCFNFGKNYGKPVATDPDYLKWMLGGTFLPETKAVARQLLDQLGA